MFHNSRSGARTIARKRPVQARSRDTVATILEAAAHVVERRGYAGFTTNHVAARAGVSIGSIYQYFHDKDALLGALVTQTIEETERALLEKLASLRGGGANTAAWARALVRVWCETHDAPHHALLYPVSLSLPQVSERAEAAMRAVSAEVARQLRQRGVAKAAVRARVIVLTCATLVHELVIASPPGPARRAAERESGRMIAAYLGSLIA